MLDAVSQYSGRTAWPLVGASSPSSLGSTAASLHPRIKFHPKTLKMSPSMESGH